MTCNFRVGQKVVCVNDDGSDILKRGTVYTIAAVFNYLLNAPALGHPDHGVLVEEVKPSGQRGFAASRFRPVVERKTDISVFKALLTPSKEKVETAS